MWWRSRREFLTTSSMTSSSILTTILWQRSCGLHPLPLSSLRALQHHHCQPVSQPFLSSLHFLLQLPTSWEAPSSVTPVHEMLWRGCSYSSKASSNGGGTIEVGGQVATTVTTCWKCGTSPSSSVSEPFLVCKVCRSIQPMDTSVDYFQIFGLENKYELRSDDLEIKYKDWQKKLHPDLVHTKSERERSYAAEQSARVIDAYRTLSSPITRALYLLKLEGLLVDEEKTVSDPELLAEVMEIREAVEEANDYRSLEQIKSELQGKLQNWSNAFGEAFRDRRFEDAVTAIQRMTYYERAIQEIVKKL